MGFLTIKSAHLSWEEAKEKQDHIKYLGFLQIIELHHKFKDLYKSLEELK
jgi:hypothetical protein